MRFCFVERLAYENVMDTLEKAAKIASDIVNSKEFFMDTMCEVLNDVARLAVDGLEGPTKQEVEQIYSSIRYTIHFDGKPDSYMQCKSGKGEVFISRKVCPIFPSIFNFHTKLLISLLLILNSGLMP
jgi:hypothetical protein